MKFLSEAKKIALKSESDYEKDYYHDNMMQQQSDAELARKLGDEESKNYAELAKQH